MITTLVIYLCTSAAMDDCQAHPAHQWGDQYQLEACMASIEPTLNSLRAQGVQHAAATCAQADDQ